MPTVASLEHVRKAKKEIGTDRTLKKKTNTVKKYSNISATH